MMAKILSDLLIDLPNRSTYARFLGAVKLKENEESPVLETCAVGLGELSVRSTET